jgi:[ribosomal protein S5]-alanine N-acetyltransferase
MVTIKTKDFILRPMTLKDAQGYLENHEDREARRNFMSVPKNLKETRKEIKEGLKKSLLFLAIEVGDEFVGFISLKADRNGKYSAVISYGINKKFRNKGLATKAVKKVTDYGLRKLKLKRISGTCRTFNKASAQVMEKSGYKLEGILRKNKFKDGKYFDDMVWARNRE